MKSRDSILRRRGLGRYVSQRSIIKDLSMNFGITEMITQAGFTPGTRQSSIYYEPASLQIAETLGIEEGDKTLVLDRVRTADDQPVVWSRDILAAHRLGDKIPKEYQLEHQSLYSYLQINLQIRVSHGTARVIPAVATAEIAAKLQTRRGAALLIITQTDYDASGEPIIYSIEYHVPDKFVFVIHRKGPD